MRSSACSKSRSVTACPPVRAAFSAASLPSDSIDLVDEDDSRGRGLGLLEEVAPPAGTHAHEDLDELGGADAEEGPPCLPGHGAREQGLAAAGRPDQQHALGNTGAQALVLLGVAQEVHLLLELALGGIDAGHVGEGGAGALLAVEPGLALA